MRVTRTPLNILFAVLPNSSLSTSLDTMDLIAMKDVPLNISIRGAGKEMIVFNYYNTGTEAGRENAGIVTSKYSR